MSPHAPPLAVALLSAFVLTSGGCETVTPQRAAPERRSPAAEPVQEPALQPGTPSEQAPACPPETIAPAPPDGDRQAPDTVQAGRGGLRERALAAKPPGHLELLMRAAQAGALEAAARLIELAEWDALGAIDPHAPAVSAWSQAERSVRGMPARQVYGCLLANWAARHLAPGEAEQSMRTAREHLASEEPSHPLLASELAWLWAEVPPKNPERAEALLAELPDRLIAAAEAIPDPLSQGVLLSAAAAQLKRHRPRRAASLFGRAAEAFARGEHARARGSALHEQADACVALGEYRQAHDLYQTSNAIQARTVGPRHPRVAAGLNDLAGALRGLGRYQESLDCYRRAIAIYEQAPGPQHAELATCLGNLAGLLRAMGRYEEALSSGERALATRERLLGPEHRDVGLTLNTLAEIQHQLGRFPQAHALYERSRGILERAPGERSLPLSLVLNNQGLFLLARGHYQEALSLLKRSLEIRERTLGPWHPQVAAALNNLALVLHATGRLKEARELAQRSLGSYQALIDAGALDARHPDIAQVTNNLSAVLGSLGLSKQALPLCEQVLQSQREALGPEHPSVALVENNLGALLLDLGRYEEARERLDRAGKILEGRREQESPDFAKVLNNRAELLSALGRYREACRLLERSLAIRKRVLPADHPDLTEALDNLGALHCEQGNYAQALQYFKRSLDLVETKLGSEHPDVALALNNLGGALYAMGCYWEALPLVERAHTITKRSLPPEHPWLAKCLTHLAGYRLAQDEHEEARALLRRALAIREASLGSEHPDVAKNLEDLARLEGRLGSHQEAYARLARALTIREQAFGRTHPAVATSLEAQASLLHDMGNHEEARQLLRGALEILVQAFHADHPRVARVHQSLGELSHAMGQAEEAHEHLQRALSIVERRLHDVFPAQSSMERLETIAAQRSVLDAWLTFSEATGLPGYAEVLRFKGLVGRVTSAERRALRQADGETRERYHALLTTERQLAKLYYEHWPTEPQRKLWRERLAKCKRRIERQRRELGSPAPDLRGLRLEDIATALQPGERLVDVLRYGDRYACWVVGPGAAPVRVELGAAGPIDEAAGRFAAAAGEPTTGERELLHVGRALRQLVWAPLEECLAGAELVYFAPDGALSAVPIAALPGAAPHELLLERLAVVYLESAHDLASGTSAVRSGRGLLVFDCGRADSIPGPHPLRQQGPLSQSAAEGAAVASGFRTGWPGERVTVRRSSQATEAALRRAAPGARIVQLMAHGFDTNLQPSLNAAKERQEDRLWDLFLQRHLLGFDPLLHPALVLAKPTAAEHADDDGFLTALEASRLDLDGVELVVLAACQTVGGVQAPGEVPLGMLRAFRLAGARNVVGSLWKVDDRATRELMERFYAHLSPGGDPGSPRSVAHALRAAALELREVPGEQPDPLATLEAGELVLRPRYRHPYYWAAFVAYGPR